MALGSRVVRLGGKGQRVWGLGRGKQEINAVSGESGLLDYNRQASAATLPQIAP